mgnify:CR=1 FL=1
MCEPAQRSHACITRTSKLISQNLQSKSQKRAHRRFVHDVETPGMCSKKNRGIEISQVFRTVRVTFIFLANTAL